MLGIMGYPFVLALSLVGALIIAFADETFCQQLDYETLKRIINKIMAAIWKLSIDAQLERLTMNR